MNITERMKNPLTVLFYGAIALVASLSLSILYYWSLRLNSSAASFIENTKSEPIYLFTYAILTFGAILLFGTNAALFAYHWRKFGPPRLRKQTGTGVGSLVGFVASACPVCGSTILAAIGITSGLAAFPLGGLELKALSFALIALSFILSVKDIRGKTCGETVCPVPQDASYGPRDKDTLVVLMMLIVGLVASGWDLFKTDPLIKRAIAGVSTASQQPTNVADTLLPEEFRSKIALGTSVLKLIEYGVIDRDKFETLYSERNGLPNDLKDVLHQQSREPIVLTRENANVYLNLLWPLGLANHMSANERSPINDPRSLFNFASTGGWTLGKESNGGAYFNKFKIVPLTADQEAVVVKIAQNSYRPCCNNSAFFQDCNHGSALLGLLQLGAAQGLSEEELWKEALAFNAFWFPTEYSHIALYFKNVKGLSWDEIDPKVVLGKDYSSAAGWTTNVYQPLQKLGFLPQPQGGGGCGT